MLLLLLSLIPYSLTKCFTGKLGFYMLLVKATVFSVAFTKLHQSSWCGLHVVDVL